MTRPDAAAPEHAKNQHSQMTSIAEISIFDQFEMLDYRGSKIKWNIFEFVTKKTQNETKMF